MTSPEGEELWAVEGLQLDLSPVQLGDPVFEVDDAELVVVNSRSGNERGRVALPDGTVTHVAGDVNRVIIAIDDRLFAVQSP